MAFNFLKSLDADDIFISYAREDGSAYLTGLDAALSKSGFSCFTDKRGTEANRLPPKTLFRKIRSCKTLVLLATPCALSDPENIAPEVSEFADANGTSRIVSVSFDRDAEFANWSETPWFSYVEGKAREREALETLKTGEPSSAVVASIVTASDYMKSKDRLRKYRNRALAGFLALLVAGVGAAGFAIYGFWQAGVAKTQASEAKAAADKAQTEAQVKIAKAEDDVKKATDQAQQDIKKAQEDAQTKIDEANTLAKAADGKRVAAERQKKDAEQLRDQARADAEKQGIIGESRRLANSSQAWLRQRPEEVPQSLTRAMDAMNKAGVIKMHILEADTAIRDSLALLPRLQPIEPHKTQATMVLSPDGRHFAELNNNRLLVYSVGSPQTPRDIPCECSAVALSSGAAYAAAVLNEGSAVRIIDLNNDKLSHNIDVGGSPDRLSLSPAGRYLALSFVQGEDIGTYSSLQVRETSSGKIVKSFDGEDTGAESSTTDSEQRTKNPAANSCGRLNLKINSLAFGSEGSLVVGGKYTSPEVGRFTGRVIIWPQMPDPTTEYSDPNLSASFPDAEIVPQSEEVKAVAVGGGGRYFATDKGIWKKTTRQAQYEPVARLPYSLEGSFQFDPDSPATSEASREVTSLAFSVDGGSLVLVRHLPSPSDAVSTDEREVLEAWDAIGHLDLAHVLFEERIGNLGFVANGESIAVEGHSRGPVRMFQTKDGAEVKAEASFGPKEQDGLVLYTSPGEGLIVTANDDAAAVWDLWKQKKIPVPFGNDLRSVDAATLSPGGNFLALSGPPAGSAVVAVYRLEDGSYKEWKKPRQNGIVKDIFLSTDGRILATRNDDDIAHVFDVNSESEITPKSLLTFRGVKVAALSSKGRFLVVAGRDDLTRLLDLANGSKAALLPLLDNTPIESLAFSPDERYVGVGSEEGILHVFDLNSPLDTKEIARLAHVGAVNAIAFSNDDKYVATASSDPHPYGVQEEESYPLRVWLLRPDDLIAEADRRLKGLPQYPR